jgi:hypothetical protein
MAEPSLVNQWIEDHKAIESRKTPAKVEQLGPTEQQARVNQEYPSGSQAPNDRGYGR